MVGRSPSDYSVCPCPLCQFYAKIGLLETRKQGISQKADSYDSVSLRGGGVHGG